MIFEVLLEQISVLIWASIQQNPKFDAQVAERFLEGLQADFRQLEFVLAERKPLGRSRHLWIDPIGNREVVRSFLSLRMILCRIHGCIPNRTVSLKNDLALSGDS